jgi:hypothetical protein
MKLALLGKNLIYREIDYRGLDRDTPNYIGELPDDHPINQTWWNLVDRRDEYFLLDNLEFARQVVNEYSNLNPPINYEIVEITDADEQPETSSHEFLGFDIDYAYHISTLSVGFKVDQRNPTPTELECKIFPLFQLVARYFSPLLNRNGLFTNVENAKFCLEVQMALQKVVPGLYESDQCEFQVRGLWKVI